MPVIEKFTPRALGPKPWGIELLVADTPHYIGKVMWMKAGHGGEFQYHERKDEAFFMFDGIALLRYRQADGTTVETSIGTGDAIHIPPGAAHQVTAVTDCIMFETSTPVFDDRVAVEGVPI